MIRLLKYQSLSENDLEREKTHDPLDEIIIFPGNKLEFEELMGYKCFIIDLETRFKGVTYVNDIHSKRGGGYVRGNEASFKNFSKDLFNKGIVGLIHAKPVILYEASNDLVNSYYGLPVGKKK